MLKRDNYFYNTGVKFIRDPVHKADIILSPYEISIINTSEFQRLRGIKQLGPCEIVWHGATHNRFQHSIGTLFMVEQILSHADKHEKSIPLEKRIVCRLLGLLHDIGHIPFGHTIEDERPAISGRHTDRERIKALFDKSIGLALDDIEKLMDDPQKRNVGIGMRINKKRKINSLKDLLIELICECKGESDAVETKAPKVPDELQIYIDIVGNTVCADLFDYLRRDAYGTGLRRDYDDKIMFDFKIYNNRLVLDVFGNKAGRSGTRTEIVHLIDVRYTLAERVYFNATKMWAAAMISKAVEITQLSDIFLRDKRDDELLWLLEHPKLLQKLLNETPKTEGNRATFKGPNVDAIKECLGEGYERIWFDAWRKCKNEKPDFEGAAKLISSYKRRAIFRPIYLVTESSVDKDIKSLFRQHFWEYNSSLFRLSLELFLSRLCGIDPWEVIICCPDPPMNLKFANPLVGPFFSDDKRYKELSSINIMETNDPNVSLLVKGAEHVCQCHWQLWRFGVLAPESLSYDIKSKLAGLCQDTFRVSNELNEYISAHQNLQTIVESNITEAYRYINKKPPTKDEIRAIIGGSDKGRAGQPTPGAYFIEDYIDIISNMS